MTPKDELKAKIGAAWKAHYAGQNAEALAQFKEIAQQHPQNIDVLWGLGLSYRKVGDLEQAVQVFRQAQTLIVSALETVVDEHERYLMLKRMVAQQIEQVGKFLD